MIDINQKPSEELPQSTLPEESAVSTEPDKDDPETLIVAPPTLRERIQAAQRARTLQIQPNVELPSDNNDAPDTEA